jgi:hypothetical protein
MPRDKYAIERMFNFGGSRFYGSNTDFENKSYYRNRDGQPKGKGSNIALKIANQAVDITTGETESATAAVVKSRYQSLAAAFASA